MKKFFGKPAQNMTIGDSLVFSMLIGAASLALVVPIVVVSALIEGQIDLPKVGDKLKKAKEGFKKRIKRHYINLAEKNDEEGEKED